MAQVARSTRFLKKAEAALVSAIEVYNRPTFEYREETFAILALNAWELLLKAKLLAEHGNKMSCLYAYEKRDLAPGKKSKKLYVKRNRTGSPMTVGLGKAIVHLAKQGVVVDAAIKSNLDALSEIRDNAIHFVVASPQLAKQVLEVGTAAVRNFIEIARVWFRHDLSGRHFFLMPIGFIDAPTAAVGVALSKEEGRLIEYLRSLSAVGGTGPFNTTLEVGLSFKKTTTPGAAAVAITNDPAAPRVALTEEDFRKFYKWTHTKLLEELKSRYADFKADKKFVGIKRALASTGLVTARYLDPDKPRSGKKDFYNPSVLGEFDKHYTKR